MEILLSLQDGLLFVKARPWSPLFINDNAAYFNEFPRTPAHRQQIGKSKFVTGDFTPVRFV